jgi:hypothetical protein
VNQTPAYSNSEQKFPRKPQPQCYDSTSERDEHSNLRQGDHIPRAEAAPWPPSAVIRKESLGFLLSLDEMGEWDEGDGEREE